MSKNKEFKNAVKEAKAAKIPVIRMIKNNLFMVKYATKYDKKLVLSVITLFCILQVLRAVQSTIILKIIIDMLQGDGNLKNLLLVLLGNLIMLVAIEWIDQLLQQWSKAKLVRLGGRVQRDLMEKNGRVDLLCYDSPEYYDMYISVASKADEMVDKSVNCISTLIGSTIAMVVAAGMIVTIHPLVAIFPVAGFIANLMTRFKITRLEYEYDLVNKKYMSLQIKSQD